MDTEAWEALVRVHNELQACIEALPNTHESFGRVCELQDEVAGLTIAYDR